MTTNVSWMPPRWLAWTFAGLAVSAAVYWGWWQLSAYVLRDTLNAFRAGGAGEGVRASWDAMSLSGFPLRLRAKLDNPRYENQIGRLAWQAEGLTVETSPWSAARIGLMAHGPQKFQLGSDLAATLNADESGVGLMFGGDGLPKQLDVAASVADLLIEGPTGVRIGIKGNLMAAHWRIDPADADPKDGRDYDVAINGSAMSFAGAELPFGQTIQDFKLQLTLRGIPALQQIDGAMDLLSWRQSGAPMTVRKLSFVSGGVDIQGAGDLKLGPDRFLEGQLNLTIGGLDKIVNVLSERGAIPAEAKTTLFVTSTMLSATGAKVPMPLIFKDGKTYLGPAPIGPAPRLVF